MNGALERDLKSLEIIFERNKYFILPILIIFVSIFIFFQFVIPQFYALLAVRQEAEMASQKLQTLKENLNILSSVDEESLDAQLEILSVALPLDKDFNGMLNSIYASAQKTGVGLGPFSLQIGELTGGEEEKEFPTITLMVPLDADISKINEFVEAMNNSIPLSEVSLIKKEDTNSSINLSFYYKPLSLSGQENPNIKLLSEEELLLIDKLIGFGTISPASELQTPPIATSSPIVSSSSAN